MSTADNPSFAATHADPSRGFRAVPRWFRQTPFWQSLSAAHRAVIDELYHRIASEPVTQFGTGISLDRGQWAISYEALGEASGATPKQARTAVAHAAAAGVIRASTITKRLPTRTLHLSVFTWLDFDTYDRCTEPAGSSPGKSLGSSPGKSLGSSVGKVRHHGNTPVEDTKGKTPWEDGAAAPPAGSAGSPLAGVASPSPVTPEGETQRGHGTGGSASSATTSSATPTTGKSKAKKPKAGTGNAKPAKLTDEQLKAVCDSPLAMMGYWAYGADAVGKPMDDWAELPPSQTHWAPAGRDLRRPEPGVGGDALAAWVWVQFCRALAKAQTPRRLPVFPKLCGTVKGLRSRMPQEDLVALVETIRDRWGEISPTFAWMSAPPQLDEVALSNHHVVNAANRLASGQSIQTPAPAADRRPGHDCSITDMAAFCAQLDSTIGKVRL